MLVLFFFIIPGSSSPDNFHLLQRSGHFVCTERRWVGLSLCLIKPCAMKTMGECIAASFLTLVLDGGK